ncbi:MAG: ATP synthase F1 subunit delta [bacterium]|nr:ATP synthase F1 subunit delta [bacterium]
MKDVVFLDALAEALIVELPSVEAQDDALTALEDLARVMREDAAVRDHLLHSTAPYEERLSLLESAIKDHVPMPLTHTLLVLLRDRALAQLDQFVERFKGVRRRMNQARYVEAVSAIELTKQEKERLKKTLAQKWGLAVSLRTAVDPSLIGGFRLVSGDWEYDASVAGRLRRLTQALKA